MTKISKRLEQLSADLVLPDMPKEQPSPTGSSAGEAPYPDAKPVFSGPRTGPGQLLAFRQHVQDSEGELAHLRAALKAYGEGMATCKLDPQTIRRSHLANRHPASFKNAAFARLKSDIEAANGNVQPILVRKLQDEEGVFEIVFGHRRHQACLELGIPVLASIWDGDLSDADLFLAMDRENREREDPSPYEQGLMYHRALETGLFSSQRSLAEAAGISHTWVRKVLVLAQLPPAILECFRSPLEVTHRHGELLDKALSNDRRGILKRAEKLRGQSLPANTVVEKLLGGSEQKQEDHELKVGDLRLGKLSRRADGSFTIQLVPDSMTKGTVHATLNAIERIIAKLDLPD